MTGFLFESIGSGLELLAETLVFGVAIFLFLGSRLVNEYRSTAKQEPEEPPTYDS